MMFFNERYEQGEKLSPLVAPTLSKALNVSQSQIINLQGTSADIGFATDFIINKLFRPDGRSESIAYRCRSFDNFRYSGDITIRAYRPQLYGLSELDKIEAGYVSRYFYTWANADYTDYHAWAYYDLRQIREKSYTVQPERHTDPDNQQDYFTFPLRGFSSDVVIAHSANLVFPMFNNQTHEQWAQQKGLANGQP